jgi:signal transduction histidine kinase
VKRLRPLSWLLERPTWADAALAVALATLGFIGHIAVPASPDNNIAGPSVLGAIIAAVGPLPLIVRRRHPLLVMLLVLSGMLTTYAMEWVSLVPVAMLVATYTFGSLCEGRRLLWAGGTIWVGLMVWISWGVVLGKAEWPELISNGVIFATSFIVGDNVRRRRERQAELLERAERAERERELLAVHRVQQERARIARELHDVVAHSVSLMVIQAGAARRTVDADPQRAGELMLSLESTGREAMIEMRRVLGVLRDDGRGVDGVASTSAGESNLAPQPDLASLRTLIAETTDLPVSLSLDVAGPLPAAVELCVFRVVQEALTNVRRHAGPVVHVRVEVRDADEDQSGRNGPRIVVVVADDGRGASADVAHPGYGVLGMRERVGMFGGTLDAGPRPGGGWRVRAEIPTTVAAAHADSAPALAEPASVGGASPTLAVASAATTVTSR